MLIVFIGILSILSIALRLALITATAYKKIEERKRNIEGNTGKNSKVSASKRVAITVSNSALRLFYLIVSMFRNILAIIYPVLALFFIIVFLVFFSLAPVFVTLFTAVDDTGTPSINSSIVEETTTSTSQEGTE